MWQNKISNSKGNLRKTPKASFPKTAWNNKITHLKLKHRIMRPSSLDCEMSQLFVHNKHCKEACEWKIHFSFLALSLRLLFFFSREKCKWRVSEICGTRGRWRCAPLQWMATQTCVYLRTTIHILDISVHIVHIWKHFVSYAELK